MKEVLVSVGDKNKKNITAIYEFKSDEDIPFTYKGQVVCDTIVRYRGANILWGYKGDLKENLYNMYVYYEDSGLKKLAGTIYDDFETIEKEDMSLREIHELINGR